MATLDLFFTFTITLMSRWLGFSTLPAFNFTPPLEFGRMGETSWKALVADERFM